MYGLVAILFGDRDWLETAVAAGRRQSRKNARPTTAPRALRAAPHRSLLRLTLPFALLTMPSVTGAGALPRGERG